jgi:hypothetical protein
MKRFIIWIFTFLIYQFLAAQEPVKIQVPDKDSVRIELPSLFEPGIELPDYKEVNPLYLDLKTKLDIPAFDFSRYLHSRWNIHYFIFNNEFLSGINRFTSPGSFFSPFGVEGVILNQAVYQVSDKVIIGGNNFGMNSLLNSPLNYPGSGRYNIRGASLFMEYKVTKNFRIGGSVSVSGNPYQP